MKNVLRFLIRWVDRLHWLWLALAAPFLLFPTPRRSFAMLVVPGIWLLHGFASRQTSTGSRPQEPRPGGAPLPLTPLNVPILLIALMVLVSLWATYDVHQSLPKVSGMVLAFGVFFAFSRLANRWQGWLSGFGLFLALGIGIAALGFLNTRWEQYKFGFLNPVVEKTPAIFFQLPGAAAGLHPNEVAGALIWVLPLLLALSVLVFLPNTRLGLQSLHSKEFGMSLPRWSRWLLRISIWGGTILVGFVFALTQSRSGFLGLGFALLLILWMLLPIRARWIALFSVFAAGAVLWFGLPKETIAQGKAWLLGRSMESTGALSLGTLDNRFEIWSRALYGLGDFPFTGMGMNTFRKVVHLLYPLAISSTGVDIAHAHNEFLQAGLDLGIPGLVAFLSLYILAFGLLLDLWHKTSRLGQESRLWLKTVVLGFIAAMFAHLVYGMTDAVALGAKPGVLFWMLLALIAGLSDRVRIMVEVEGQPPRVDGFEGQQSHG